MPDGGLITPVLKVQLSLDHELDLLFIGLAVCKLELMLITKLFCVLMDLLFPMLALPTPGSFAFSTCLAVAVWSSNVPQVHFVLTQNIEHGSCMYCKTCTSKSILLLVSLCPLYKFFEEVRYNVQHRQISKTHCTYGLTRLVAGWRLLLCVAHHSVH